MKKKSKGFYVIISSVVLAIMQFPFSFAKSATGSKTKMSFETPADSVKNTNPPGEPPAPVLKSVYDSLHLDMKGLSQEAFDYAAQGLDKLIEDRKLENHSIVSIIDFSLPSNKKRLFIIDLDNYKVLFNTLVSHGKNTGHEWATSFSNQNESYKSSPGFCKIHSGSKRK